jgi:uncharacterized protein (DUF1684 family)
MVMSAPNDYASAIDTWRKQAEARLKAPDGWLSVAGLFWLKEGANTMGSAPGNAVVLPATAPKQLGTLTLRKGSLTLAATPGTGLQVNGKPAQSAPIASDANGAKPDLLTVGPLTMFVIVRGDHIGIRLRDQNSEYLRNFTHRNWYPVKPEYRVEGQFEKQPERTIRVATVIADVQEDARVGGVVRFRLNGQQHVLEPHLSGDQLFFVFKDKTAGKATYGAGRFLYADLPDAQGRVTLDFNKAYNPPCVFTPHATCPLPPKHNVLPVPVEAGELNYGTH